MTGFVVHGHILIIGASRHLNASTSETSRKDLFYSKDGLYHASMSIAGHFLIVNRAKCSHS